MLIDAIAKGVYIQFVKSLENSTIKLSKIALPDFNVPTTAGEVVYILNSLESKGYTLDRYDIKDGASLKTLMVLSLNDVWIQGVLVEVRVKFSDVYVVDIDVTPEEIKELLNEMELDKQFDN